jgi:hypothetical protein
MGRANGSGPSGRPDGETHHHQHAWLMGFAKVLNPSYDYRLVAALQYRADTLSTRRSNSISTILGPQSNLNPDRC